MIPLLSLRFTTLSLNFRKSHIMLLSSTSQIKGFYLESFIDELPGLLAF